MSRQVTSYISGCCPHLRAPADPPAEAQSAHRGDTAPKQDPSLGGSEKSQAWHPSGTQIFASILEHTRDTSNLQLASRHPAWTMFCRNLLNTVAEEPR
ncbi:hypothetical protein NDU88_001054 [Pleurodeles waltl]|uniref:Uncharacterized protein n=1 Tax=Pleurodeles waltl TaxID=8319 RepID=A0AAV7SBG6_PLEWA|nr:hypothetical protein NDU88_001054 [Pleurodeles waltl]